jgi:cytochrome c oxidase cbb3-type subunit 3/ubiquinol-cytochrome c reductase cytochrome c subunit
MTTRLRTPRALPAVGAILLVCAGCTHVPGVPSASADVARPDKQLDFHVLYKQNCSGCHGENGRGGAAIPLNNPAYLAIAGGDNLRTVTAKGMRSTMMPAFAASSGGMLTEQQVDAVVQGILREWSRPSDFSHVALPPYSDPTPGNPTNGQIAYSTACARCHGTDGIGVHSSAGNAPPPQDSTPNSIVDTSYLALVNDQSLRSLVVAGHPDANAPDWRSYISGRALTSQEITDIVAWLAQHRAQQSISIPPENPSSVAAPSIRPRRTDDQRQ